MGCYYSREQETFELDARMTPRLHQLSNRVELMPDRCTEYKLDRIYGYDCSSRDQVFFITEKVVCYTTDSVCVLLNVENNQQKFMHHEHDFANKLQMDWCIEDQLMSFPSQLTRFRVNRYGDRSRAVSISNGNQCKVNLWDTREAELLQKMDGPHEIGIEITECAISSDGARIAIASKQVNP